MYIADHANHRIRKVDHVTGIVTTVIGTGISGHDGNGGPATNAKIMYPSMVAVDEDNNIYFVDGSFHIRKVTSMGIISTIAGNGSLGYSGDGGPATAANINVGGMMTIGNHNDLVFADGIRVRKVDLSSGIITTIAGNGVSGFGGDGGQATAAQFFSTMGIAVDASDNVYVGDRNNHRVRKINSSGIITTVVGNGISGFTGDGSIATLAQLYSPRGLAVDECDNLYIVDNGNRRVRSVTYNPACEPVTKVNNSLRVINLTIFPNPIFSKVTISSTDNINSLCITNFVGQLVYEQKYANEK